MNIPSKCLRCDRSFDWNEVIIWKMPENVWFCMDCITEFPDDNVYEWENAWITTEYQHWITIELEK